MAGFESIGNNPSGSLDKEEMQRFGLDPDNLADRVFWEQTTPQVKEADQVADYGQDPFEFGARPTEGLGE